MPKPTEVGTVNCGFCISGAFEDTSFASLAPLVSENTLKGVKEMGFEHMTEIQHKSIQPLLEGRYAYSLSPSFMLGRIATCLRIPASLKQSSVKIHPEPPKVGDFHPRISPTGLIK